MGQSRVAALVAASLLLPWKHISIVVVFVSNSGSLRPGLKIRVHRRIHRVHKAQAPGVTLSARLSGAAKMPPQRIDVTGGSVSQP